MESQAVAEAPVLEQQASEAQSQQAVTPETPTEAVKEAVVTPQAPVQQQPEPEPIDPFVERVLQAHKAGDLQNFLKTAAINYDNLDDVDVFRAQIRKENPKGSDKLVESLLRKQLEKYDAGFDEDDREVAEELRKLDANKIRDEFKAAQVQYKIPDPSSRMDPESVRQQQQEQVRLKEVQTMLNNDPALKEFEMNRVLTLGQGDDAFKYAVPATVDVRSTLNSNSFYDQFWTKPETGNPVFNMQKWTRVVSYASDPDKYDQELIKHAKTLGSKAEFEARHNPDTDQSAAPPPSTKPAYTVRRG